MQFFFKRATFSRDLISLLEVYFSSLYLRQFLFRSEMTWLCKMLTRYFFLTLISKVIYSWSIFLIFSSNPFHRNITGPCFSLLWSEISKRFPNPKSIGIHAVTSLYFTVVTTTWHPVWWMKSTSRLWLTWGQNTDVSVINVSWPVPLLMLSDPKATLYNVL
jgi:hypothetical protein